MSTPITQAIETLTAQRDQLTQAIHILENLQGGAAIREAAAQVRTTSTIVEDAQPIIAGYGGDGSPIYENPKKPQREKTLGAFSGDRLRYHRQKQGLSQAELCDDIGVRSQAVLSRWERGITTPNPAQVETLARALRVRRSTLCPESQ